MDWQTLFFTTGGRIGRRQFIAAVVAYVCVTVLALFLGVLLLTSTSTSAPLMLYVGANILVSLVFFSSLTVTIKRLHDRDKSGWWAVPLVLLPGLLNGAAGVGVEPSTGIVLRSIAGLLVLWWLVELVCLPGTKGPNRFGPEPTSLE